jgi:hypothetical protein
MSAACLIPDCDGRWHDDGICDVVLSDLQGDGASLIAEVEAGPALPATLVVWEGADGRDLIRTTDPGAGHAFADRLRLLAAAIDKGAALLARVTTTSATPDPSVDYAARFAALDSDVLFDLEDTGDCDDAQRYVQSLLMVLAEWRPRVLAMLADAPEWAVPEAGAYRRALDRTREAWVQYEFRYDGGPVLPFPFDLPEPAPKGQPITLPPVARIVSAGRRPLTVRGAAA